MIKKSVHLNREALNKRPKIYCTEAETELHTHAFAQSYAAILLQRDDEDRSLHPVYYTSGKTKYRQSRNITAMS